MAVIKFLLGIPLKWGIFIILTCQMYSYSDGSVEARMDLKGMFKFIRIFLREKYIFLHVISVISYF